MSTKSVSLSRQDWALFGLRWILLLVMTAILYIYRTRSGIMTPTNSDLLIAFTVGALVNVVFFVFAMFPTIQKVQPLVIMLGDWVIAGFFLNLTGINRIFMIAITGSIMTMGALRLGLMWGLVQSIGTVGVMLIIVAVSTGFDQFSIALTNLSVSILLIIMLGIAANVVSYVLETFVKAQEEEIGRVKATTSIQVHDMQERTRAITEMSAALGSTLNYEKVLGAALEAGRLGMRDYVGKRLTSAVLLFQDSGDLHVATSRGLTRSDEGRNIPGKTGIVGKTLTECVPIFGKDVRKDPELQYFVGFQTARSVLCIPLRARYDNFGVLLYGSEAPDAFTEEHMDLLTAIGTQATIALQNAVLYRNLLLEKERIVEVEEDARKKLARDLHDGPTQNVSAIAMRMSYIYRLLERKPEDVPAELKKVEELARKTTKEIRHMLFTLRPLVLESQGLTAALNQLAEKIQETHGQAVAINVGSDVERVIDSHQQGVIFYIVEEAVGNARKHAEAELISVNVQRRDDMVIVEIADNGVGFDTGAVDANYDQRGSLGMVNMRERTELLDGTLRIESAEGRGTTITVVIPVKSAREITHGRTQKVNKSNHMSPSEPLKASKPTSD
jgi:signal transduction histidine kinase